MKLTYQAILEDPSLLDKIEAQARRERAEAAHRLIIAPLKALFNRPPQRRTRMLRRSAVA